MFSTFLKKMKSIDFNIRFEKWSNCTHATMHLLFDRIINYFTASIACGLNRRLLKLNFEQKCF